MTNGMHLSGLHLIGLFVGLDMLFNGWSLVMLGLAAKKLPEPFLQSLTERRIA